MNNKAREANDEPRRAAGRAVGGPPVSAGSGRIFVNRDMIEGLDFIAVASIRALPGEPGHQACQRIGDKEQHTKPFVLPDMHKLVCPKAGKLGMTDADYCVAKRDGCERQAPQH